MTTEYKEYWVWEADFGASTSLAVKIENGKVTESLDTSSYETNWAWDGGFEDDMLKGKTKEEAQEIMDHWFDDFEDDYRRPHIRENILDARDWTRIKAQRLREEKIRENIKNGVHKSNERYKAQQEHKDVLAEKEELLDSAFRNRNGRKARKPSRVRDPYEKEKNKIRLEAYKKFAKGNPR